MRSIEPLSNYSSMLLKGSIDLIKSVAKQSCIQVVWSNEVKVKLKSVWEFSKHTTVVEKTPGRF